ncbi:FIST signal transduction protein [Miltoncostaea marina]|uniref:FIST signal transduction protein n=1 Tax=Miltoncostaea marina TaxID=2843215 RepID=UPI001C3CCA3F|nr:FIST N-terminal domain-containing protein [Miltoncostaea marina]
MGARATFGAGLSRSADARAAAAEACAAARAGLGPGAPTLVVVFASPDLCDDGDALLEAVHGELAPEHLIGGMAEAVVAEGREVEGGSGLAVWAARLPGIEVIPFRLVARPLGEGLGVLGWPDAVADAPAGNIGPVVMLADPFTFPADGLLDELNQEPGAPVVVGGLVSGARRQGDHRLFAGRDVLEEGAVAVALRGAHLRTVVSQGCRPVGPEMTVTAAEGAAVHELAGRPALQKLQEVIEALEPRERDLALNGLLTGVVIDENRPEYERGDFLVRPIHGGDRESGALMVGQGVRVGQTMRFHVRDADSADEDLRLALRRARAELGDAEPGGAILFTCNGRGSNMFAEPDHDASAIAAELGPVPVAGLFCNGEIGPVGGRSFLHGFTATMVLFGVEPGDHPDV